MGDGRTLLKCSAFVNLEQNGVRGKGEERK